MSTTRTGGIPADGLVLRRSPLFDGNKRERNMHIVQANAQTRDFCEPHGHLLRDHEICKCEHMWDGDLCERPICGPNGKWIEELKFCRCAGHYAGDHCTDCEPNYLLPACQMPQELLDSAKYMFVLVSVVLVLLICIQRFRKEWTPTSYPGDVEVLESQQRRRQQRRRTRSAAVARASQPHVVAVPPYSLILADGSSTLDLMADYQGHAQLGRAPSLEPHLMGDYGTSFHAPISTLPPPPSYDEAVKMASTSSTTPTSRTPLLAGNVTPADCNANCPTDRANRAPAPRTYSM